MKNFKKLIAFFLLLSIFTNCKENETISLEDALTSNSIMILRKINSSNYSKSNSTGIADVELEKIDFYNNDTFNSSLTEYIEIEIIFDILSSIIYFNNDVVVGYELFYVENAILKHSFFKKEEGLFKNKFDLRDNKIRPLNIEFVLNYYLSNNENLSAKLIFNNTIDYDSFSEQNSKMDVFKDNIIFDNTNSRTNNQTPLKELVAGGYCWSVCIPERSYGDCDVLYGCQGGACSKTQISDKLKKDKVFSDELINQKLVDNDDLHYAFRDFLSESNIGNKYISYYYSLSSYIDVSSFSLSDFTAILNLMPNIDSSISFLLDNNSTQSKILISEEFKIDIINLIEILKTKSNDYSFQNILNDIENDVNNFSEKSKEQILNEIY